MFSSIVRSESTNCKQNNKGKDKHIYRLSVCSWSTLFVVSVWKQRGNSKVPSTSNGKLINVIWGNCSKTDAMWSGASGTNGVDRTWSNTNEHNLDAKARANRTCKRWAATVVKQWLWRSQDGLLVTPETLLSILFSEVHSVDHCARGNWWKRLHRDIGYPHSEICGQNYVRKNVKTSVV